MSEIEGMRKEDAKLWKTIFSKLLKNNNIHISEEDKIKTPDDFEVSRPIRRLKPKNFKRSKR